MKIKCTLTGGEWWVDYIVATNPRTHECRQFYGGYELIPDESQIPPQVPGVESELVRHDAILIEQARCIGKLHGNNNVIAGRLDAIEEEYAKAKSWINTLISDNQRLKERLNAIEGNWR